MVPTAPSRFTKRLKKIRTKIISQPDGGSIFGFAKFLCFSKERCPPGQKSRVERLKAKVESLLTSVTVDDRFIGRVAGSDVDQRLSPQPLLMPHQNLLRSLASLALALLRGSGVTGVPGS